jgi:hypothetical protein
MKSTIFTQAMILSARYGFMVPTVLMEILLLEMLVRYQLTEQQLLDFDYSETMARFKVVHEMESRGMKGQFAGGYTTAGNPKHYKFRTTSIGRKTHKQRTESTPIQQYYDSEKRHKACLKLYQPLAWPTIDF